MDSGPFCLFPSFLDGGLPHTLLGCGRLGPPALRTVGAGGGIRPSGLGAVRRGGAAVRLLFFPSLDSLPFLPGGLCLSGPLTGGARHLVHSAGDDLLSGVRSVLTGAVLAAGPLGQRFPPLGGELPARGFSCPVLPPALGTFVLLLDGVLLFSDFGDGRTSCLRRNTSQIETYF